MYMYKQAIHINIRVCYISLGFSTLLLASE